MLREERVAGYLPGVHVILQQLRIVIGHLLEVRHAPALVHRVAVESAGHLVVHSAARHLLQRGRSPPFPPAPRRCARTSRAAGRWRRDEETWAPCRIRRSRGRRRPAPTAPSARTMPRRNCASRPRSASACSERMHQPAAHPSPLRRGARERHRQMATRIRRKPGRP